MDAEDETMVLNEEPESEVQIRFVSKLEIELPENQFAVPDKLARYGLSEIINHLLGQTDRESIKPYDFLIDGEFLRTTLKKYLASKSLSGEAGLTVEVVEAVPAPDSTPGHPHPDWVSSISSEAGLVVSGCYDGVLRIFPQISGQPLQLDQPAFIAKGHTSSVTGVSLIQNVADGSVAHNHIISTSKDRTARVWQWDGKRAVCRAVCKGHRESVEAVATLGERFCTGSWDKTAMLWDVAAVLKTERDEQESSKKRKTDAGIAPVEAEDPLLVFEGHTQAVSSIVWPHPAAVYTGSWDMSIRMWDTETAQNSKTWHGNKMISSLTFSHTGNVLASAHNDKTVRIWDPRLNDAEVCKLTLRSHKSWVTSVAFHPISPHILASASHDNTVKLWDIRSKVPLHTLTPHTDKVLCLEWVDNDRLVSGAADCKMQTHALRSSSSQE